MIYAPGDRVEVVGHGWDLVGVVADQNAVTANDGTLLTVVNHDNPDMGKFTVRTMDLVPCGHVARHYFRDQDISSLMALKAYLRRIEAGKR